MKLRNELLIEKINFSSLKLEEVKDYLEKMIDISDFNHGKNFLSKMIIYIEENNKLSEKQIEVIQCIYNGAYNCT